MLYEELTEKIIGAAIEVHRILGPGLLESTYNAALAHELYLRKIPFQREVEIAVDYKGVKLGDEKYRIDFLIDKKVILEAKSVLEMHPVFTAQTLTHMKHAKIQVGLLINFNVKRLIDGLNRLINTQY
ncbi:GxxExxY protein [candidate division KSB1 bacterium]|nr:GxxExxY protein [candidate division KSB1 bacterium]